MELELKKQAVKYKKEVFKATLSHEETQEIIVSDTLPDISEIIDTCAYAFLRGKDTDAGKVTVGGSIEASVLFSAGEGNKTRNLSANIPFTVSADGREITEASDVIACVSVAAAETKIINPRKVLVKVNLCIEVSCFNECQMEISCAAENAKNIECLTQSFNTDLVKNVSEKTFVVSDEFAVSGTRPIPGDILSTSAKLFIEDTKTIGSKLIVSGRVASKVLYLPEDGEEVQCAEFSTMFSQIIELNEGAEDHNVTVCCMLTGAYYNISELTGTGEKGIVMELHGVIQCVTSEKLELTYLADIFSTKHKLTLSETNLTANISLGEQVTAITARGTLPAAVAPEKIITTNFSFSDISVKKASDSLKATATAFIKIIYLCPDGQVRCASGNIECTCDITGNDPSVQVKAGDEIYVSPMGMEFEVRLPVTFVVTEKESSNITYISNITFDENEIIDTTGRPSITLYRTSEGDTVWSLCKRFLSERKLIIDANCLEESTAIKKGQLIIIPKAR